MKFRLLITASFILLTFLAFFIRIYTSRVTGTVSGNTDLYSCGYVPCVNFFLYINMDGKVLSVTSEVSNSQPVIEGLKFNRFIVGDTLETENNEAFTTIARLMNIIKKYGLEENFINKIDVANLDDIHLYIKNVNVAFGTEKDADEKIRTLREIMANLRVAEDIQGLLDIRVIGRQYVFKVLT